MWLLCWVFLVVHELFIAACRLSLAKVHRLLTEVASLGRAQALGCVGFSSVVHGLSCPTA